MKVKIRLKSKQKSGEELDEFTIEEKGVLLNRGKSYLLSYFQDNIHHSLEFFPSENKLVMMRNWKETQRVEYLSGIKWSVDYETELGAMPLSFDTKEVKYLYEEFSAGRAELRLSYLLYQFEEMIAETELSIAIFPLKG